MADIVTSYLDIGDNRLVLTDAAAQGALETKANIDGSYDTMTVGNAEQLVSSVGITDKVPYNFRTAGGSVDIGDRLMEKVVGGTIAWNQMVQNGNFNGTTGWSGHHANISASGNTLTFTITDNLGSNGLISNNINMISGHKYMILVDIDPNGNTVGIRARDPINSAFKTISSKQMVCYIGELSESSSARINFQFQATDADTVVYFRNVNMFDLTQMFGSTIADYIYSLEQSTAGAGVAWFKKLFPKDYYAYNAGELMSVQAAAHKTVGFNQWDEEWELGYIGSAGNKAPATDTIRSKNYIPALPNTYYHVKCPVQMSLHYYDASFNHISGEGALNRNVLTPSGTAYMLFYEPSNYGTTYNHDICINLHWDGERDGEYEPYVEHVYPLDDDLTLRGIPKLDSNNELYYDGDTYESDGTVTRRYAVITLDGSDDENWAASGSKFYSTAVIGSKTDGNAISNEYKYSGNCAGSTTVLVDKSFYLQPINNRIWVYDTGYSDLATFKTALGSNPLVVVYELATPTTETADAYQNPQIVDDFGTEEYTDAGVIAETRDVAVPVGHESIYQPNLRAKLEMSPNSPDGDGDYIVRQTNGLNEYVPLANELPTLPSENGTYALKITVSGTTKTLSWVAEE